MEELWSTTETSNITVSTYTTVTEVPPNVWAQSGHPGSLYCSGDWFRLAEISGARFQYLVARDFLNDEAVAVLPVLLDAPRPGGSYDHLRLLVEPALGKQTFEQHSWSPTLVAGSWNSNLAILPLAVTSRKARQAILRALLNKLEQIAEEGERRSISIPFLTTELAEELAALIGERGLFFRTTPTTWTQLRRQSFADFLASCNTNRRRNIQRELNAFQATDSKILMLPLNEALDEIVDLVMQNKKKYGGMADREKTNSILLEQARVFGDRFLSLGIRRHGRLIAVANMIVSHGGLYTRSFGFDYTNNVQQMEYFMLVYYEPFRYCIEHGVEWYHAGPQAYQAKVRRGLDLVPLWTLLIPDIPPTHAQRVVVQHWNNAEVERWRNWFAHETGKSLPQSWRSLNTSTEVITEPSVDFEKIVYIKERIELAIWNV